MNSDQLKQLEDQLWKSADTLRANSGLKSNEYATPILGLIFLKFADNKYRQYEPEITREYEQNRDSRAARELHEIAIEKCGFYLPPNARYDYLLNLPESADIAKTLKEAMQAIEKYVPFLQGTLPTDEYFAIGDDNTGILKRLLTNFSNIPTEAQGDLFGKIYEYFLSRFALAEGQGGGEFFTPPTVVRLMVEIIEPHKGRVFDPACGSGGMFVQSARFIEERRRHGGVDTVDDLFVCGQEKTLETVKLAKMNLAVNGLRGEIKQANSYSSDAFDSFGNFDYVLANPPFNVDEVDVESVINDRRFTTYGIPRNKTKSSGKSLSSKSLYGQSDTKSNSSETVPNANYLWIGLFATSLKDKGRAALVMANSASDAQHTEADIRRRLIEADLIYGMLTLPSNMFYTVTLPATLWFFEKNKSDARILFIDARNVFTQVDRAHREFTDDQVQDLAVISYLHRGERSRFLERIHACLLEGSQRMRVCQIEFRCVQETLLDALAEAQLSTLLPEQDTVAQTAEKVRDEAELLALLWKDEEGRLKTLLDTVTAQADATLLPDMSDTRIAAHNGEQQALVTAFFDFIKEAQSFVTMLDRYLRDYEKAITAKAEADSKRRPQDKKLRDAKAAWEAYSARIKAADEPFVHARWLHDRFPDACYVDVIGLCKLATKAEVAAQDYSLNAGRYVGIVIEEDGKTADEFRADLLALNTELETLNAEAASLAAIISHNIQQIVGSE